MRSERRSSGAATAPRGEGARPPRPPARPCEAGAGLRDAWVARSLRRTQRDSTALLLLRGSKSCDAHREERCGWAGRIIRAFAALAKAHVPRGGAAACARSLRGSAERARFLPLRRQPPMPLPNLTQRRGRSEYPRAGRQGGISVARVRGRLDPSIWSPPLSALRRGCRVRR